MQSKSINLMAFFAISFSIAQASSGLKSLSSFALFRQHTGRALFVSGKLINGSRPHKSSIRSNTPKKDADKKAEMLLTHHQIFNKSSLLMSPTYSTGPDGQLYIMTYGVRPTFLIIK